MNKILFFVGITLILTATFSGLFGSTLTGDTKMIVTILITISALSGATLLAIIVYRDIEETEKRIRNMYGPPSIQGENKI